MEDKELLLRYRTGDESSLYQVFRKYDWLMKYYSRKYSNTYHFLINDMDDLYQEALLACLYAVNKYEFNSTAKFDTFLSLCIKGYLNKYLRNKRKTELDEFYEDTNIPIFSSNNSLESIIQSNELERQLHLYIESLNDVDSMILKLYRNNFSNKEISEILDIPYKKVDNRLYLIKKNLLYELKKR